MFLFLIIRFLACFLKFLFREVCKVFSTDAQTFVLFSSVNQPQIRVWYLSGLKTDRTTVALPVSSFSYLLWNIKRLE